MHEDLEDERDRTVYVEYFPRFCITAVWYNNGKLDYYNIGSADI